MRIPKKVKDAIEALGHAETILSLIKVYVWPVLFPALAVLLGYLEGQPWMYVLAVAALVFGGVATGILRFSEYRERKNPAHKLVYEKTDFSCSLNQVAMPVVGNRLARRVQARARQEPQMLGPSQLHPHAVRKLTEGQIGVFVRNTASFPISVLLSNASTKIEDATPPRTEFPKGAKLLGPGERVRISDDPIDLDEMDCETLTGEMTFVIKYGLPGDEKHELRLDATLQIQMERFGFITSVLTNWKS